MQCARACGMQARVICVRVREVQVVPYSLCRLQWHRAATLQMHNVTQSRDFTNAQLHTEPQLYIFIERSVCDILHLCLAAHRGEIHV